MWLTAVTSEAGTPHCLAAAWISISRAAAPAWRKCWKKWRVEREPSVSWLPKRVSSPQAWTTFTFDQSASSSSATVKATEVRIPWPMSERWLVTVTVPSGAIATKTFGSSRQPCGMPSAPNFCSFCSWVWVSSARAGRSERASTRAPAPPRMPRRLTLSRVGLVLVELSGQLGVVNHRRSPLVAGAVWPAA